MSTATRKTTALFLLAAASASAIAYSHFRPVDAADDGQSGTEISASLVVLNDAPVEAIKPNLARMHSDPKPARPSHPQPLERSQSNTEFLLRALKDAGVDGGSSQAEGIRCAIRLVQIDPTVDYKIQVIDVDPDIDPTFVIPVPDSYPDRVATNSRSRALAPSVLSLRKLAPR